MSGNMPDLLNWALDACHWTAPDTFGVERWTSSVYRQSGLDRLLYTKPISL
jgi:hypothetical protein